jgi:hypothetical protein
MRPILSEQATRFMLLERAGEQEYRPQMREALQRKVDAVAEQGHAAAPRCRQCAQPRNYHDARPVGWQGLLGACRLWPFATVVPPVNKNDGLGWRRWRWSRAAFAVRWHAGWLCWLRSAV